MVYMSESDVPAFEKNYMRKITNLSDINLGDCINYENPKTKLKS